MPTQPLTQDVQVNVTDTAWSYPQISIHETAESLLSGLFPYQVVNPSDGVKEAEITAGSLLIGDKDRATAISNLSKTLGVNWAPPGTDMRWFSYVMKSVPQLTRPSRINGRLSPSPYPEPEARGKRAISQEPGASVAGVE